MWMNDLWHKDKVIIGMLHLDALPGDPRYTASDSLDIIVEHARMDLKSLIDGGVDAILISNEFSSISKKNGLCYCCMYGKNYWRTEKRYYSSFWS